MKTSKSMPVSEQIVVYAEWWIAMELGYYATEPDRSEIQEAIKHFTNARQEDRVVFLDNHTVSYACLFEACLLRDEEELVALRARVTPEMMREAAEWWMAFELGYSANDDPEEHPAVHEYMREMLGQDALLDLETDALCHLYLLEACVLEDKQ